jgi:5-methylcytosine-specific restriction endonuclease McrA
MPASSSYRALYGTARWKRVRRLVLARAGGRCEMTPGCERPASTVDHIVPALELAMTGRLADFYDPALLQAACTTCNTSAGASFGNRRRRHRRRVTVMEVAQEAAIAYAQQYEADMARLGRERLTAARPRRPAIY